jgi:two-component system nitrogen regulation sensor histidine kinase NtrY
LFVLLARRVARSRARRDGVGGGGRLHVRLVATFSVVAAVPTLLVVVFASLLFQIGVEFWFSDKARVVLVNADRVAQAYVAENGQRIVADIVPMAGDLANVLSIVSIDDPRFSAAFARQVAYRNLSEAALVAVGEDGALRLLVGANLDSRPLEKRLPPAARQTRPRGGAYVATDAGDRVETVVPLDPAARTFLYASRRVDPQVLMQAARARAALSDYTRLVQRSRVLQLRFNAALLLVSLLIVGAAIWIALKVADRLVRPVNDLVDAARRVTAGDLSTRVGAPIRRDEVGTLATAFNRMTRRLEEQTGALVTANSQLENRRAFTEAVLSGVSAGVVSIDGARRVRLINQSAQALLGTGTGVIGRPLGEIAPELDALIAGEDREAIVEVRVDGDARTLAVRRADTAGGHVVTFDDITQQLTDQRRAAWADVARRIAHEIKNPLTPIQLAAERLQRRYGREIASDPGTFERLTGTIVRQVGDLRRMVDEFSSFARMPKPLFRREALVDIARQSLFLHEVAHPKLRFTLIAPDPSPIIVCDRRQLGQAFTNVVKNAVEAIEARGEQAAGIVAMEISVAGDMVEVAVADDGIGLPGERERITEPYVTTRERGTGLGLAIVKKIVEEHFGTIAFADRPGGGTIVRITLDAARLAPLAIADPDETAADGDDTTMTLTRGRNG